MWGFVVSSLFIMTLANVSIVFSDESISSSSESISEIFENLTDSTLGNESGFFRGGKFNNTIFYY